MPPFALLKFKLFINWRPVSATPHCCGGSFVTLCRTALIQPQFKVFLHEQPQHPSGAYAKTLTKSLQNLNFVCFDTFRGGLALMLWNIVLSHNLVIFELQITDWWLDIVPQNFLVEIHKRIPGSSCSVLGQDTKPRVVPMTYMAVTLLWMCPESGIDKVVIKKNPLVKASWPGPVMKLGRNGTCTSAALGKKLFCHPSFQRTILVTHLGQTNCIVIF